MASNYTSTKNLTGDTLLGDVRRNNNFVVTIVDVTENEGQNLDLIIRKAFLPKVSLNVLDLRHGNDALKFPGVATWEGGTISIIDVLNKDELDALLAWYKKTYDWETGTIGVAREFKKIGYITEYASDGRFRRKWNTEGMWISALDLGELDASSGELKQITATIQIDPSRNFAPEYSGYTE